jgi:HD-like signal output (HDOD) protein
VAGLEQEIIGFTHAEVGALLIKHWGLPASIFETINYYLKPELSQSYKLDTFLLNLASQLIDHQQEGRKRDRRYIK